MNWNRELRENLKNKDDSLKLSVYKKEYERHKEKILKEKKGPTLESR